MSSHAEIQRRYDRRAGSYDRTVGCCENLVLGDLRMLFATMMEGRCLEVAIGSGLSLPGYSVRATSLVGVDLSREMLRVARRRAASIGIDIDLVQMDAERLAFEDGSFDTVGVSLALCTTPDPERAIAEMARVCRPDGSIVFLEHMGSSNRILRGLQTLGEPVQQRVAGCSLVRDTGDLIEKMGFDVVFERRRWGSIFRLIVAKPVRSQRASRIA